jgi:hypothetical protein
MSGGKQGKEAKATQGRPSTHDGRHLWIVPRNWLILALVFPWLAVGAYFLVQCIPNRSNAKVQSETASDAESTRTRIGNKGPWGELEIVPITIAPPLEFIPADEGRPAAPEIFWHFQDMSVDDLADLLARAGLSRERQSAILDTARDDPSIRGVVTMPPLEVVRALSPQERESIYLALARCSRNDRQQNAFRFFGSSLDDWFEGTAVSKATRDLIRPFVYSHGGFLQFADIDLVRDQVKGEEKRRLIKALFREATCLVKLHVPQHSNVDEIAEYWGRGGRSTDINPLIEAAADIKEDFAIDIIHLLPQFVRQHLYRYPRVRLADLAKQDLMNCFWSSLNFFNESPDDRYLDPKIINQTIQKDYYLVHNRFNLGDLVLFSDSNGNFYHAAAYLADGLVFTKNGNSPLSPWIIVPLERVKGYYPQYSETGFIQYFRRRE